jgi:translation initiation factor 1
MASNDSHTVWSSDSGDQRKKEDRRPIVRSLPPEQQTAYLHRDSKGRGGKGVTLIRNLILSDDDMTALAKKIKQACGAGGTVKEGVIEIQGENCERIADVLTKLGYKVKLAGG